MNRNVAILSYMMLFCNCIIGQYTLRGTVTNEHNESLEGASVFVLGSDYLASITDHKGRFLIENAPVGTHNLKVTYLGHNDWQNPVTITDTDIDLDIEIVSQASELEQIQINALRLEKNSVFSYYEQDKEEVSLKNLGQDVPFLLEHTPSTVVTSDAGAGIGYTGIRIRGSDATRINVTINGIPLNDSESHGVFWVDLPDFGSSVDRIQIQRGVGPSSVGAGAFGATVALNTNTIYQNPYIEFNGTIGSFGTRKLSASVSTGLMNNQYSLEGRYSLIESDGYIDRATSDLNSWYFSAAKISDNSSLRFNIFSGHEITYQSWFGVPESKVKGDDEELRNHYERNIGGIYFTQADSLNLFNSGRNYNYYLYPNQVDDYRQTHAQIIYAANPSDKTVFNLTGHYTRGIGFFEEFVYQDNLDFYGIRGLGEFGNVVRRRWLDNHFFGGIASIEYSVSDKVKLTGGAAGNVYLGDHFGNAIRVESDVDTSFLVDIDTTFLLEEYYRSDATKIEHSQYIKADIDLTQSLSLYGDIQSRVISYETAGLDSDTDAFNIDESYHFINPKFGLNYQFDNQKNVYISYAQANREPVRSDFLDAKGGAFVVPEQLHDIEAGLRWAGPKFGFEGNLYYQLYNDQLVITGAVNDVGAAVRTNVDKSFRRGIELAIDYQVSDRLSWKPNLTLSQNKIEALDDVILDFVVTDDNGNPAQIVTSFEDTNIALSPSVIAGSNLTFNLIDNLDITWLSKYVGKQYLDNTQNENRIIDPYWVNDVLLTYKLDIDLIEGIEIKLLLNNILSTDYSSNGYTFSYALNNDIITENYLYPQAPFNALLSGSIKF